MIELLILLNFLLLMAFLTIITLIVCSLMDKNREQSRVIHSLEDFIRNSISGKYNKKNKEWD